MPLYEYKCLSCGRQMERIERFAGPHLRKCPHCGGKVERLIAAPAIQFKGAGWYVTDYAKKSASGDSDKPAAESKDAAAKGGKDQDSTQKETSTKESKEKKPAKKSK